MTITTDFRSARHEENARTIIPLACRLLVEARGKVAKIRRKWQSETRSHSATSGERRERERIRAYL